MRGAGKWSKKACDASGARRSTKMARRLTPQRSAERRVDSVGRATRVAADEVADPDEGSMVGRATRVTPAAMSSARAGAWRVGAPEPVARETSSAPEATRRGADEVPLRAGVGSREVDPPVSADRLTPSRELAKSAAAVRATWCANRDEGRGALNCKKKE